MAENTHIAILINPLLVSLRQCNFNFSIYKTNYSSQASEASGDGLHPTNEAHKLFLYTLVREFVKKLL